MVLEFSFFFGKIGGRGFMTTNFNHYKIYRSLEILCLPKKHVQSKNASNFHLLPLCNTNNRQCLNI